MTEAERRGLVERLADLAVRGGANVQPGQVVAVGTEPGKEELTRAVAERAYRAGARFVDVGRSLRGHELCTADSWVHPLGRDADVSSWAHPTAPGQQAIADRVTRSVRRLG